MTTAPLPTIERRNHGTGHSYRLDGEKAPGVTTILRMLPKEALINWAATATADHAIDYWDELSEMRLSERHKRLERAHFAVRDTAAKRGTQVHRLAAQLADGIEVAVPEELEGHVDSYLDFLTRVEPDVVAVELVVGCRAPRFCGTTDLIADLPDLTVGDEVIPACRWLLELKTSRSGIFRESALQTCAYSRADAYVVFDDLPGGVVRPMSGLGIDRCGAVHVRGDGWDFRPLDASDETWAYFGHLAWLYEREELTKWWVGQAADPPPLPRTLAVS